MERKVTLISIPNKFGVLLLVEDRGEEWYYEIGNGKDRLRIRLKKTDVPTLERVAEIATVSYEALVYKPQRAAFVTIERIRQAYPSSFL